MRRSLFLTALAFSLLLSLPASSQDMPPPPKPDMPEAKPKRDRSPKPGDAAATGKSSQEKPQDEMQRLDMLMRSFSQMADDLNEKEAPQDSFTYQCHNIKAATLRRVLESFISSKGEIAINEETDQIIVRDSTDNLPSLRKIIEDNDVYVPQVLAETQIVEFSIGSDFEKNLTLSYTQSGASPAFIKSMTSILGTPGANPDGVNGGQFTILAWKDETRTLTDVVRFLETRSMAKILSAPNLVIRRGGEGNIFVGEDLPIVTTVIVNSTSTTSTTFRSTGIKLNVTPTMIVDDSIRLEVNPEVSDNSRSLTSNDTTNPVISMRQVRTQLDIKDGQTLAIGGLYSSTVRNTAYRVPVLGSIPLIGKQLFQSQRKIKSEVQLVVFLKVRLIRSDSPIAGIPEASPEAKNMFETLEKRSAAGPLKKSMQDIRLMSDD